jgi:8-oxo-dGTP pyrophosphatase MutT (NUDIX family)
MACDDWPLPRQPATARALITDQAGRWLIVKDHRPHWYLPGGLIEQDEPPRAACEREVLEETGLTIQAGELLVFSWQPATKPGRFARWSLIFDGGPADCTQPLRLDDEEVRMALWAEPDDALRALTPAIAQRLTGWRATTHPAATYIEHTSPRQPLGQS